MPRAPASGPQAGGPFRRRARRRRGRPGPEWPYHWLRIRVPGSFCRKKRALSPRMRPTLLAEEVTAMKHTGGIAVVTVGLILAFAVSLSPPYLIFWRVGLILVAAGVAAMLIPEWLNQ